MLYFSDCFKQIRAGKVPKLALTNGLYKGTVPSELKCLNFVELSMISIYSTITKIGIQGGKNSIKMSSVYTVVNNTATIAATLPMMPTLDTIALLRHKTSKQCKDWNYRPGRVREALAWLKMNNVLYKDVIISYPSYLLYYPPKTLNKPFIPTKHRILIIIII